MYVTLLLLAPAVCEWVEISQHHYSGKPARGHLATTLSEDYGHTVADPFKIPHRTSPDRDVTDSYEDTTVYRKPLRTQYFPADGVTEVYVEDVSDSRYRYRKPTRTHLHTTETEEYGDETTSQYRKPTRTHFSVPEEPEVFKKPNRIYLNQSISGNNQWNKGNVNKVPKHGNVQRVQLDTNVVKAPNVRPKPGKDSTNLVNSKNNKSDAKDLSEVIVNTDEILQYSQAQKGTSNKNSLTPELTDESLRKSTLPGFENSKKKFNLRTDRPKDNITLGSHFSHHDPDFVFVTKGEEFDGSKIQIYDFDKHSHPSDVIQPTKMTNSIEKGQINRRFDDNTAIERNKHPKKDFSNNNQNIYNNKKSDDFATKTKQPIDEDYATVSDDNDGPSVFHSDHKLYKATNEENLDSDGGEEDETSSEPSNDSKSNTMENLMTLMKVVANTIRRNTKKSVNSKTQYLTNLKNTILSNIKEKIDATWPDDPPAAQAQPRVARAAQATARGHLEIPSSESALMTISFLTFAVFLIKLVLQVIQAYKNKTMMVTPAVVATVGRAALGQRSAQP